MMEKSFVCWSPLDAPAVACGADRELQEPDTAADGPKQRAVAAGGCRNTLSTLVAFSGLEEKLLISSFLGGDTLGRSTSFPLLGQP